MHSRDGIENAGENFGLAEAVCAVGQNRGVIARERIAALRHARAPDAAAAPLRRCAAEPGPILLRREWVPALRSSVKDAAARPGHGRHDLLTITGAKLEPSRGEG